MRLGFWKATLGLAVLLGIGSAIASANMAVAEEKQGHDTAAKAEDGTKSEEKSGHGGLKLNPDQVYVNIGPIILPVITEEGPQQIVTMLVSLEVKDLSTSDKVREKLPRLVDAYMGALYGRLNSKTMIEGKIVDVAFVKSRLMKATERVLGPGMVQDVLIQAVAQRQL